MSHNLREKVKGTMTANESRSRYEGYVESLKVMIEICDVLEERIGLVDVLRQNFWKELAEGEIVLATELGIPPPTETFANHPEESREVPIIADITVGVERYHSDAEFIEHILARDMFNRLREEGLLKEHEREMFFRAIPFNIDMFGILSDEEGKSLRRNQLQALHELSTHPQATKIEKVITDRADIFLSLYLVEHDYQHLRRDNPELADVLDRVRGQYSQVLLNASSGIFNPAESYRESHLDLWAHGYPHACNEVVGYGRENLQILLSGSSVEDIMGSA